MAIVILNSEKVMTRTDMILLDQFLLSGGDLIWMIENYDLTVDSIGKYGEYIPQYKESGVEDFLFKSGVKLKRNWITDLQSSRIPQVIGEQGGKPQTELFNYPFHPVVQGNSEHVISRSIKALNLYFPTSMEIVNEDDNLIKTPLLLTSEYSKEIASPHIFSFDFLRTPPEVSEYSSEGMITALMISGQFKSYFENRLTASDKDFLNSIGAKYLEKGSETSIQFVMTDAEFALPTVANSNSVLPIGSNKWERFIFEDNRQFVINCIEFALNGNLFLNQEKQTNVQFASLDKQKIANESTFWTIFNLIFGPIILLVLYVLTQLFLKWKYAY
jgi:gliding-associated putative ABC transporter substrate-binding component GldG